MTKRTVKFGSTIPELRATINRFGCGLADSPAYIVLGQYSSETAGPIGGILAAADNEFYAYAICREVNKNGQATVERTEYHPRPTFSITIYKKKLQEIVEKQSALKI